MTISNPPTSDQTPQKPAWFVGCAVTALVILFVFLGVYNFVFGSMVAYIFTSAGMLNSINVGVVFIVAIESFSYFFLAFRFKQQHWLVSSGLVILVWLVLPLSLEALLNITTMRVQNQGFSMGETLPDQSYILADKFSYQHETAQRGDIIIFSLPLNPDQNLIKRIIGLPGETIEVKDGSVRINGVPLEESYSVEPPLYNGTWVIPEGQYFVLGDNRNASKDSHEWGFLPRENILAKAVWIYYPLAQFGRIDAVVYQP